LRILIGISRTARRGQRDAESRVSGGARGIEHGTFSAPADFALKTPAESGPYGGAATSREGARRVYGEFFAGFDEVEFEAEEFFDHNGWVLVHIVMRARPPGTSATIERRGADLWTMQDGRPVRLDIFTDREEAEKAVEKIRRAHQEVLD
jgi:hypothetical protein